MSDIVERLRRINSNRRAVGEWMADEKGLEDQAADEIERLRAALRRIRDCDWVITLPDRMDAVRDIARKALGDE
jgi:ribosomal protein L1